MVLLELAQRREAVLVLDVDIENNADLRHGAGAGGNVCVRPPLPPRRDLPRVSARVGEPVPGERVLCRRGTFRPAARAETVERPVRRENGYMPTGVTQRRLEIAHAALPSAQPSRSVRVPWLAALASVSEALGYELVRRTELRSPAGATESPAIEGPVSADATAEEVIKHIADVTQSPLSTADRHSGHARSLATAIRCAKSASSRSSSPRSSPARAARRSTSVFRSTSATAAAR